MFDKLQIQSSPLISVNIKFTFRRKKKKEKKKKEKQYQLNQVALFSILRVIFQVYQKFTKQKSTSNMPVT